MTVFIHDCLKILKVDLVQMFAKFHDKDNGSFRPNTPTTSYIKVVGELLMNIIKEILTDAMEDILMEC